MTELKKEELLDIFDGVFSFYLGELGHEEDKVKIEQAKKQIVALIQKPGVTEEFITEKAKLFVCLIMPSEIKPTRSDFHAAKEFLRSLVEEIHGRK